MTEKVRSIYQKTKAERMKLKSIKQNIDIPFTNKLIIHISADSDIPTIVAHRLQKRKLNIAA